MYYGIVQVENELILNRLTSALLTLTFRQGAVPESWRSVARGNAHD